MKFKKFGQTSLILAFVLFILSGCKVQVESEVKLSDLLDSTTKNLKGNLYLEVAACNNYEDSRKPSSPVLKAQQSVPNVFKDAEFVECFSREFTSYAHFTVPILLDKDQDGKLASDDHLNIVSSKKSLLEIGVPSTIKDNIKRLEDASYGTESFELDVSVRVVNDTGNDFKFKILSAYVEEKPFIYGTLTSKSGGSFTVKLSDVSTDHALESGTSKVLLY